MPVRKSVALKTIVVVVVAVAFAATVGTAAAHAKKGKKLNPQHRILSTEHAELAAQLDAIQAAVDALPAQGGTVFPGDGVDGPPLHYQDNGDGTVTDLNTGLMWEQKVAGGGGCTTALHAVDATCPWAQATGAWIDAVNAEGFAGYNDWRYPNVRELMSIVDYSTINPAIALVFGPTAAANYWSSTSGANNPGDAWSVFFFSGFVLFASENGALRVRAVRGGQ